MVLTEGKYSWFDCFYMTFITVATIGFGEIIDMSSNQPARILTVVIGILGAGNLSLLFSVVTVALLETDLNGTLRRKRMEKAIKKLKGHYILCGFGRVGRNIAHELEATNRHFVAIDEELHLLEEYKEKNPGLLYLHGDASDDDMLLAADLEDAKGLFAVTGDDSRNLMIVITAKQLKPALRVVARCTRATQHREDAQGRRRCHRLAGLHRRHAHRLGDDPAARRLLPRRDAEIRKEPAHRGSPGPGRLHSQAARHAEAAQRQLRAARRARAQRQLAVQSGQGIPAQARLHADRHGQPVGRTEIETLLIEMAT
jgi:voltage-gated potassium channel